MPVSVTSVFSEPEDFEAALVKEGCRCLLIVGRGQFQARLTQVALHSLRLSAAEERLSRIAFITVPADMVMMSFPIGTGTGPVYGGIVIRGYEIMTLGPGQSVHARTDGPCRWGSIWFPLRELARYGSALTGAPFAIPSFAQCWRLPQAAGRQLHQLHAAAIRMAEIRPQALLDAEAAHGLEQQLIHALINCLSAGSAIKGTSAAYRHQDVMVDFEALLETHPDRNPRAAEISAALGVSDRMLRHLCAEHLSMSGARYIRLRRMSLVRRILRCADRDAATVSEVVGRYGFRDLGRFAASYRAAFGELPSATLQRGSGRKPMEPRLHRTHRRK
jgi:AraC-like DNA-binding protein